MDIMMETRETNDFSTDDAQWVLGLGRHLTSISIYHDGLSNTNYSSTSELPKRCLMQLCIFVTVGLFTANPEYWPGVPIDSDAGY